MRGRSLPFCLWAVELEYAPQEAANNLSLGRIQGLILNEILHRSEMLESVKVVDDVECSKSSRSMMTSLMDDVRVSISSIAN